MNKFDLACWLYVLATLWLTTCGSPLNPAPTGGLRLPSGKHKDILTDYQTKDKEEMNKNKLFFVHQFIFASLPGRCFARYRQYLVDCRTAEAIATPPRI